MIMKSILVDTIVLAVHVTYNQELAVDLHIYYFTNSTSYVYTACYTYAFENCDSQLAPKWYKKGSL